MVLHASYRRVSKNTRKFTALLPFFGTDYGIWEDKMIHCHISVFICLCGEVSVTILEFITDLTGDLKKDTLPLGQHPHEAADHLQPRPRARALRDAHEELHRDYRV